MTLCADFCGQTSSLPLYWSVSTQPLNKNKSINEKETERISVIILKNIQPGKLLKTTVPLEIMIVPVSINF